MILNQSDNERLTKACQEKTYPEFIGFQIEIL